MGHNNVLKMETAIYQLTFYQFKHVIPVLISELNKLSFTQSKLRKAQDWKVFSFLPSSFCCFVMVLVWFGFVLFGLVWYCFVLFCFVLFGLVLVLVLVLVWFCQLSLSPGAWVLKARESESWDILINFDFDTFCARVGAHAGFGARTGVGAWSIFYNT